MLFNSSGNIGNSAETGIELSAKGTLPGGWHWSVGYSPRLVRDDLLPTQPPVDIGVDFAHMTPQHVVDVAGGWSQGPWEIDLAARFQSSIIGFQLTPDVTFIPVRVDSYLTVDIRLAYKIAPGITVSVVGRSITSGSQQQTSIGTVDRRVLGGIQMTF